MARKPRIKLPDQETVALWLRQTPRYQPWRLEGPVRAWLRSQACLQGAKWRNADELARRLVARARSLTNGTPAPRGWDLVDYLPQVDARLSLGRCSHCNEIMEVHRRDQLFCGASCRIKASYQRRVAEGRNRGKINYAHRRAKAEQIAHETVHPRICAAPGCDNPLPPGAHRLRKFCSPECKRAVDSLNLARTARRAEARAAKANGHALPNGHDHETNGSAGPGEAPGATERAPAAGIAAPRGPDAHHDPTAG